MNGSEEEKRRATNVRRPESAGNNEDKHEQSKSIISVRLARASQNLEDVIKAALDRSNGEQDC